MKHGPTLKCGPAVPLKYAKLVTEYPWIYGDIFCSVERMRSGVSDSSVAMVTMERVLIRRPVTADLIDTFTHRHHPLTQPSLSLQTDFLAALHRLCFSFRPFI